MATDVLMPRLSDSMEEGTVLKWLVEQGGTVKRGEPLVEIETDKANMTYEADTDGVLIELLAKEGDTLEVGQPIARIGAAAEAPAAAAKEEAPATEQPDPEPVEREPESSNGDDRAPAPVAKANGGRVKASPLARRMAGELGIELARVEGSGPGGRVVKGDVAIHEPTRLQRTVSRRMAEAKATVPDFSLELDVDMTLCIELRERLKAQTDRAPSFNDMVVKAAALALRYHPRVNGAYRDGKFEAYSRVNVGVAVAAQDALVVPVVHDADQKSLGEISRQALRLIACAAARSPRPSCQAAPSASRTSACTASSASPRSSTRPRRRSSPSAR
jgi:pyruvate dehydrogenase E2 component (dihydrolipoamide acetyltransferase)